MGVTCPFHLLSECTPLNLFFLCDQKESVTISVPEDHHQGMLLYDARVSQMNPHQSDTRNVGKLTSLQSCANIKHSNILIMVNSPQLGEFDCAHLEEEEVVISLTYQIENQG